MKIWYLNHYAGGSDNPKDGRSFFLPKGILNSGYSCSVIGASFHHHQKNQQTNQTEKILKRTIDDIPFLWIKTPKYQGNGLSRIRNMLSYAYSCWKYDFVRKQLLEKPDAIIISSVHPFHILAGIKWARKYNAKLVFEVRDLWPLSLNLLLGVSKYHPLSLVLSALERTGYRKSDLVVSVLTNALQHMQPKGVNAERFLYLPNGYIDNFNWQEDNLHSDNLKNIRKKYNRVIMHTGSMGLPNGLEILLSVANKLSLNPDVAFVFIGDGVLKNKLMQQSSSENIYYFDPIPKDQVLSALSYSDICYCGSQDIPELYKYGVSPNKIFDYMLAKKPILLGIESPNNPVELSESGYCFRPNDEGDLLRIIEKIIELDDWELSYMGNKGYRFLVKEHNFNDIASKLCEKLKELEC